MAVWLLFKECDHEVRLGNEEDGIEAEDEDGIVWVQGMIREGNTGQSSWSTCLHHSFVGPNNSKRDGPSRRHCYFNSG